MGLGGTTKKLQKVVNMAEELYERLNYLREQLAELSERVERTGSRVERLQREQAINRVLLERLAEQQGIDVDEARENVSIEEPDRTVQGQEPGQQQGQGQSRDRGQGPSSSSSPSSPR
jgi:peptidoglycan hydrolase CwlO-like protein